MFRFVGGLALLLIAGLWENPAAAEAQRTWYGCEDRVDPAAGLAFGQSRYVDVRSGPTRWLTACKPDGRSFAFRRVATGCIWLPDPRSGLAWEQSRVVYTDASGRDMEVSPCARPPAARSVPLRATSGGCTAVNDFAAAVTTGMARIVFTPPEDGINAAARLAQPCAPRADVQTTWPHRRNDCKPPDGTPQNGRRWSEVYIETAPARIIRSCQPDAAQDLRTTGDGCAGLYVHDVPSGVSYGTRRWYQVSGNSDGETIVAWLTGCVQDPEQIFEHAVLYTNWRNDDTALTSTALSDTVVDTPTGRVVLEQGVERLRATAYVFQGDGGLRPDGGPVSIGCETWQSYRSVAVYKRADGTLLEVDRGARPPARTASCR